jgi:hypothetical protein
VTVDLQGTFCAAAVVTLELDEVFNKGAVTQGVPQAKHGLTRG